MIQFKSAKKIVSLVSALCLLSVSCLPISASAEQYNENVQTVSNDTINDTENLYQRVLDLGFSEEEADYCFANLSTERIKFWLDCNINLDNQNSDIDTYSNDVSVVENSLKHPTYTNVFGWNTTEGTCGSVASTILLQYYKTYHNDKVGLEKYKTPEELYHAILPYIDTNVSTNSSIATMSSNVASLTEGLKNFFIDNGEPHTVRNEHYNILANTTEQDTSIRRMYITIDMCISTDKPVIAGGNYPNEGGHFVVVQGFKGKCTQDSNGNITLNSLTVTVNTGWGGSRAVETIDFIKFIKTTTTLGGDGGVTWLLP